MVIDEERLRRERPRLVQQCYRLTGSLEAAEDLAQETLYEACRNAHKLHEPTDVGPWLFAIARHVCKRWSATRGRPLQLGDNWEVADDYDLELELDRKELITLLDRALDLLPEQSREILIERYVRESPHAEIARKLGLSEDAVMKRVERGKLRLKGILSTTLIHDAVTHGLANRLFDEWEPSDIWCPICGVRRLLGHISGGYLWLICKPCRSLPVSLYATLPVPKGVKGYSTIQSRTSEEHHRKFASGIGGIAEQCQHCGGGAAPYRVGTDPYDGTHYAYPDCPRCSISHWQFASPYQVLATPEGQSFWRSEQRVRLLPERNIDVGVPGIVVGFESLTSTRRLEGVLTQDTLQLVSLGW